MKEGVLENPHVDAVFGLHVFANVETSRIRTRPGPLMAARMSSRSSCAAARHMARQPVDRHRSRSSSDRRSCRRCRRSSPPGGHHAASGDRDGRPVSGWRAQQHHSGQRADDRNHQGLRRPDAGGHSRARAADGGIDRRVRGRDGGRQDRSAVSRHRQRSGARPRASGRRSIASLPAPWPNRR